MNPQPFPTVADLLLGNASLRGDDQALIDPGERALSHSDLVGIAGSIAHHLKGEGIGRGDRLALVLPPGVELAAALLGTMAHCPVAPLNPAASQASFRSDLKRLKVAMVLVDETPPPALVAAAGEAGLRLFPITRAIHSPGERSGEPWQPLAAPGDLALVLQTSGTTAEPKVVPLSHANLLASARNIGDVLGLGPGDRSLTVMPLFHIHGIVAGLLAPLLSGGSVLCCRSQDPLQLHSLVETCAPTWLSAVPTLLQGLLRVRRDPRAAGPGPAARPTTLRFIRSSSSGLPPVLQEALEHSFGVPVVEAYGMTEAAHQICSNRLPPAPRRPGSVGPAAGPEIAVLGPDHQCLPVNQPGEVAIRGANVTAGYEAADQSGWISDAAGERWFLTGDEGYCDDQGHLVLTGRLKEMINRGGEKVIPRRVDEALLSHPAVEQALAFAVPHPTLGEDLAAAVVLRTGARADAQDLRLHAFAALAPHEVPSQIVLLDELPRGATGKLQRLGLAERLKDAPLAGEDPARGELEHLVADTFAEVLQQDRPGREANFFVLGGDSLSGQRVIHRLQGLLGLDLSPTLLFTHPSVVSLATRLDQLLEEALMQLEDDDGGAP